MHGFIYRTDRRQGTRYSKKNKKDKGEIVKPTIWTFDKIEEIGIGQLGLSYDVLYDMTPRAFWNALDGHYIKQENLDRKEWIRIRWQTCCLLNIHLPKGKQISLQKLAKFDWEKSDIKSFEETKQEYLKFNKKFKKE